MRQAHAGKRPSPAATPTPDASRRGRNGAPPRRPPSRRIAAIAVVLLLVTTAVVAAVLWRQDVAVSNAAQLSDVTFADGGGGLTGFATATIGTSGASATISLTGIAGAANLQVTDLLTISNADATQAYTVTLARSAAPNAAITSLVFTVLDGGTTIRTFDAAAAASATAFTLPVSTTYSVRVDMVVADGTAAGSLGSLDLQFSIAAV